jgi:hypothetical protein
MPDFACSFISRWYCCSVIMGLRRPRASPTSDRRRFKNHPLQCWPPKIVGLDLDCRFTPATPAMARRLTRGEREWRGGGRNLAGSWPEPGGTVQGRFENDSRTVRGRRGGGNAVRPGRRPRRWRGARRGASASGGEGDRNLARSWPDPGENLAGRFGDDSRTIRERFEDVGAAEERVGGAVPAAAPLPIDGVLLPDFSPSVKRAEWAPSVFSHPAGLASGFVAYFFASARSPAWNQR